MFKALKNKLLSVKTSDTLNFLNRWTAVISVLITFIFLSLAIKNLLVDDYTYITYSPSSRTNTIINPTTTSTIPNGFWYFNGIGITNPSTNFAGANASPTLMVDTNEMAQKCRLFGNECLGFDTLGSLFLSRDRNIASLKGLAPQYKGGLYIATNNTHAHSVCDKLGGDFNETTRICNNFNRSAINNYPFPDVTTTTSNQ